MMKDLKKYCEKFHPKPRTSSPTSGVNLVLKMCHKRLHLLKSGVLVAPAIKNKDEDWDKKCFKNILFQKICQELIKQLLKTFIGIFCSSIKSVSPGGWPQNHLVCHKITLFVTKSHCSHCSSKNHLVCHKITLFVTKSPCLSQITLFVTKSPGGSIKRNIVDCTLAGG